MPWLIVKQPNGLYARWSSVVDNFTHWNLERLAAVYICMARYDMTPSEAELKVTAADLDELDAVGTRGDGLGRWREALRTMRALGKEREALEAEEAGGRE